MKSYENHWDITKRKFYEALKERKDEILDELTAAEEAGGFLDFNNWMQQEYEYRFLQDMLGGNCGCGHHPHSILPYQFDYCDLIHKPKFQWKDSEGVEHTETFEGTHNPADYGLIAFDTLMESNTIKIEEVEPNDDSDPEDAMRLKLSINAELPEDSDGYLKWNHTTGKLEWKDISAQIGEKVVSYDFDPSTGYYSLWVGNGTTTPFGEITKLTNFYNHSEIDTLLADKQDKDTLDNDVSALGYIKDTGLADYEKKADLDIDVANLGFIKNADLAGYEKKVDLDADVDALGYSKLPTPYINNRYLKINNAGELIWAEVSGGASSFADLTGSPYDNANLYDALNEKQSVSTLDADVGNLGYIKDTDLSDYYTKGEIDTKLTGKLDANRPAISTAGGLTILNSAPTSTKIVAITTGNAQTSLDVDGTTIIIDGGKLKAQIPDVLTLKGIVESVGDLPSVHDNGDTYFVKAPTDTISELYTWVESANQWLNVGSTDIDLSDYVTNDELTAALTGKEDVSNKTTSLTPASTDNQYPTAKAVYDNLQNLSNRIPSKTSELTNDSGFITSADVPTKTSQLTNDSGFITNADIPTKVSELTNDEGFITSADVPTKTSQLTNDSDFTTNAALTTGLAAKQDKINTTQILKFTMEDGSEVQVEVYTK